MNVVKEINSINQRELELGGSGSWHDEYKDSAYIFCGGLPFGLTEGDLITIFSQFGEVMDVNMPRDKDTGKTRGFGFVMYEDQRSTVLAVDNLNGGKVLDRTIRVDHVKNYKQPKVKGEDGEMIEREEQSLNARPELIRDDVSDDGSVSSAPSIDPEDPMRDYLIAKRKEEKAKSKKRKRPDETPEERRARKDRKRLKRPEKAGKGKDYDRRHERTPRSEGRYTSSRDQPVSSTRRDRPSRRRSSERSPRLRSISPPPRRSRYDDDLKMRSPPPYEESRRRPHSPPLTAGGHSRYRDGNSRNS